jgi:hypothetical protein
MVMVAIALLVFPLANVVEERMKERKERKREGGEGLVIKIGALLC